MGKKIFSITVLSHRRRRAVAQATAGHIRRVLEHILTDLSAGLPLEELAALAELSVSQFKLNFKKEFGTSPRHFINQKKIDRAKELLLAGCSVTETAMQLGFSSSNYFSGVFKKYVFRTPSEYMREKRSTAEKGTPPGV